jgi:hypothetical protein
VCQRDQADADHLIGRATADSFVSQTASVWWVVILAFCAANAPFVSQRMLGMVTPAMPKSLGFRLFELLVFYGLVGAVGVFLERQVGQVAPQGWEFYAITGTLFVTFAFPGFVYRYLFKHRD